MTLTAEAHAAGVVTVVIVDDEDLARRRIAQLLKRESDMKVVAECRDGREAIEAVDRLRPDLLFLDVQMPEIDGFGVLAGLSLDPLPEAIFVTAHDAHAIRAFDVNALDYLLKPLDADRFRRALDRVRDELQRPQRASTQARRAAFLASAQGLATSPGTAADGGLAATPAPTDYVSRFLVKTGTKTVVVRAGDVDRIEADGNYVRLHVEARSFLLRETMNRLEKSLDPAAFVRVHRSAIVNIGRVREVEPHLGHDYVVRLDTGARVRMSRWYHEEFERRMRHGTS